jgi:hypothetical protein
VAGLGIIVMLDDITAFSDTDKLSVVRTFHLWSRDFDETLHHDVACEGGIVIVWKQHELVSGVQGGQRRKEQCREEQATSR